MLESVIGYALGKKSGDKKAKRAQQELDQVRGRLRRERRKNAELTGYLNGLQAGGGLNNQPQGLALAQQVAPGYGFQTAGFPQQAACGFPAGGFQSQGFYGSPNYNNGGIAMSQTGPAGSQRMILRA